MQLIPFDEVSRRLARSRRTYLGQQEIPVERIVGSVDRSDDFHRDSRPQRRLSRGRLASLRSAFPDGNVLAINVFESAGPTSSRTATIASKSPAWRPATRSAPRSTSPNSSTPSSNAACSTRPASAARPDAVIEFTFVDGYTQLAEIIKAHGYDLARQA